MRPHLHDDLLFFVFRASDLNNVSVLCVGLQSLFIAHVDVGWSFINDLLLRRGVAALDVLVVPSIYLLDLTFEVIFRVHER